MSLKINFKQHFNIVQEHSFFVLVLCLDIPKDPK